MIRFFSDLESWYRKVVSFDKGGQGGTATLCVQIVFHQHKTLRLLTLHQVTNARDKHGIVTLFCLCFWKTLSAMQHKKTNKTKNKKTK